MRRYLVLANLTLCEPPLIEVIRDRMESGACQFHVTVPASHAPLGGSWTEADTRAAAGERLEAMLATLEELGCEADGEIGDIRAIDAALDALRAEDYDEIIISTLPPGASRWLKLDLVSRLERAVDTPVTHVISEPANA